MPKLYLTPASISYLTQFILAFGIAAYFIHRARLARGTEHHKHTLHLLGFFVSVALFSLLLFLEASLQRGEDFYALFLQNTVLGVGLVFLLQFAYRFPALYPRRRWEAYLVFGLSFLYTLWEFRIAVERFDILSRGEVAWRPPELDRILAALLLWVPIVLLRQAITASEPTGRPSLKRLRYLWRPQGHEARAARDIALVYLIPFALSLANILAAYYLIPRAGYHISLSLGILIALTTLAVIYLDQLAETTSLIVKLVTVSLMVLLAVLGTVGWAIAPAYAKNYRPQFPEQSTLRFTPNSQGGYDVTQQPFYFEDTSGGDAVRAETINNFDPPVFPVDFTFPFYGQVYQQVCISGNGTIFMTQDAYLSFPHYRYGGRAPAIFPLLIDLAQGDVLIKQEADRLVVTWEHKPAIRDPQSYLIFQAVLYPDGTFDLSYKNIPDDLIYLPNNDPAAAPWVIGATPGNLSQRVQEVDLTHLPISGDERGIVQDYQLNFRRYLHEALAPLTYLIIGSSLSLIVGFPLLLYGSGSLVKPLRALLSGVERMNNGDYDINLEIQYPDEVGFLTRSFNTMAAELGSLITNLERRVEERLAEIKKINLELSTSGEQIAILHAIDQAILGAQSPRAIAQSILGRLPKIIPCQRLSVVEFDNGTARLLAMEASRSYHPSDDWLEKLFHATYQQPHIQGVANIRELSSLSSFQTTLLAEGTGSYMIVPLLTQEQTIGALVIESDQPDVFTDDHVNLAAQVGAMMAVAIHQAQLRISLQQRTVELQAQNAELDAFANTVAHDLKNPIGAIASSTQLLTDYGDSLSKEELLQVAQVASRGAFNAARIIDNLLLLAQTQKMTIEQRPVNIAATVAHSLEILEKMIGEYQAEIITPDSWPQALGYAPWIEEVWVNYISNALKYGGRPPRVELGADKQSNGTIRFWVRDNGQGLTLAEQARLFIPFERLGQAEIKGHGLGLSIVRRIMEQLDGQVGVESEPGQGSTFYFVLPAV